MKELIYKFLDEYCKGELNLVRQSIPPYSFYISTQSHDILIGVQEIMLWNGSIHNLIKVQFSRTRDTIESLFGLTTNQSDILIQEWVFNKLSITEADELTKLVDSSKCNHYY